MGKIIFIRHGETEYNKNRIYYGQLDPSLNSQGIEDAKNACEKIKNLNIEYDIIYSSPLLRAKETANIVNFKNLKINYDDRLKEMNFGVVEGLSYPEIQEKYPDIIDKMKNDWKNFNYISGESPQIMFERVVDFLENLDYKKTILVVAHFGVINSALSYFMTKNLDLYWKFNTKNGGLTLLKGDKEFMFLTKMF